MATVFLQGDCLARLKGLADETVYCCVTSPPYWGLRDYQTAKWEGGDPKCDHQELRGGVGAASAKQVTSAGASTMYQYREVCAKCGARRVDAQLGLEETPEEYVAHLVEVFREVKRVLRADGTLWLNLGTSYAGSGKGGGGSYAKDGMTKSAGLSVGGSPPSPSPLLWRAPACGSGGKEPQDCRTADRACPDSYDGHQGGTSYHRGRNVRNARSGGQSGRQPCSKARDTEPPGSVVELPRASPVASPLSTTPKSFGQPPGACDREATGAACPAGGPTFSSGALPSADMSVCTSGTSPKLRPLVVRTRGKESFFSACGSPDCYGIGRCGLCWCSLAIPSLNVKPKDEVSIPHLVAMALQADGWWLRSDIIWHKPNPMPSSVTDRCTTSHEYVFLLAKSPRYFYDAEAIKEPATAGEMTTTRKSFGGQAAGAGVTPSGNQVPGTAWSRGSSRNKRDVWTISTKPFSGAHFATFPPDLIEPMIKAGCPKQCCPTCGKGWERVVERTPATSKKCPKTDALYQAQGGAGVKRTGTIGMSGGGRIDGETRTLGFRPACKCGKTHSIPGTVLDPFGGAGTVGLVANSLGRNCILIELNEKYIKMARKRLGRRLLLRKTESGYTPVSEIPPLIDL